MYSLHLPFWLDLLYKDTDGNGIKDGIEIRQGLLNYLIYNVIQKDAPDYWVLGGDLNLLEHKYNEVEMLLDYCNERGFHISNYGYSDYVTHPTTSNKALDFIISSPNTIMKNVTILSDWEDKLYSDHLPLFADIILLEN